MIEIDDLIPVQVVACLLPTQKREEMAESRSVILYCIDDIRNPNTNDMLALLIRIHGAPPPPRKDYNFYINNATYHTHTTVFYRHRMHFSDGTHYNIRLTIRAGKNLDFWISIRDQTEHHYDIRLK